MTKTSKAKPQFLEFLFLLVFVIGLAVGITVLTSPGSASTTVSARMSSDK